MALDLPGMGRLITASDLVEGALEVLRTWLPPAVASYNANPTVEGITALPLPVLYERVPTEGTEEESDQTPAVFAASPGTAGEPERTTSGYDAWWTVFVVVIDREQDWGVTARQSGLWAALVRAVLLQHPNWGGVTSSVRWLGEDTTPVSGSDARTLGSALVKFSALAADVVNTRIVGPLTPLPAAGQPMVAPRTVVESSTTVRREEAP